MTNKFTIFRVVVFAALVLFQCQCVFANVVGKVTYAEGRVDITRQGSAMAFPVRDGDIISTGDSIRTKSNSRAEVKFYDESKIRLAENSRVRVSDYELDANNKRKTATINLDRGKVRTIVAKNVATSAEFNIITPNSESTVKGSDIFTYYQAGTSGVLVAEGKLEIKDMSHSGQNLLVSAGNAVLIGADGQPKGPRPYLELEKRMYEKETYVPPSAVKEMEPGVIRGVFVKIYGPVKITAKGSKSPKDANFNDILKEGDTVETGDNGMSEIKFDNGCGLGLKPNTKVLITKLVMDPKTGEYQNLFESSKGMIRARIENLKGKSSFEVKTPTAICGARATIMYIEITPSATKAFFEGGYGYLNNLISGAQTDIGMGQNGSANSQGNNSNPAPTSNEERDNWTQGWDSDNGMGGYSSPGSNDNMGNLGDNTGGNNNTGNTNNNYGETNNNNGNPNVYIPPALNQGPLPASPVPAMSLTGDFDKPGDGREGDGAFAQYYAEEGLMFDSYSSMTNSHLYGEGDLWNGPSMPFVVFGNYSNPQNLKLWAVDDNLSGSTSGNATFLGVMGGIIDEAADSIKGLFYAFYIRPIADGYRAGYIKAIDLEGGINSEMFTLTGYMDSYLNEPTSISPEMLNDSILISLPDFTGNIGGDISGAIDGSAKKLPDCNWSLWKLACGGNYDLEAPLQDDWNAVAGGSEQSEGNISYWITHIDGTKWSDGELHGVISGKGLSHDYYGNIENGTLSTNFGDLIGVYGGGSWEGLAAGVTTETPLAFGGGISGNFGYYDYEEQELSFDSETFINALFGGTELLWTGTPPITIIGEFCGGEHKLWATEYDITGKTSDGAELSGVVGGIKLDDNSLKGLLYAFYIRQNGECGYVKSTDISGSFYPDIGMFEASGVISVNHMCDIELSSGVRFSEEGSGSVGSVSGAGFFGHIESENVCIEGQNWGLWKGTSGGEYTSIPTDGQMLVGGYSLDEETESIYAYWIGTSSDGIWHDNGSISATVSGTTITTDSLQTFSGDSIGTYGNGNWQALNAGLWEVTPIEFVSSISSFISGSEASLAGFFGSTTSPWSGGETPFTFMGTCPVSDGKYHIWGTDLESYNYHDGTNTTYDGGAYYGMIGGTFKDSMDGGLVAIYIKDGNAGILSGSLDGTMYADIGMFKATGTLQATQKASGIDMNPADLRSYLNEINLEGSGWEGVSGGTISGDITRDNSTGFGIPDQGWGIWGATILGTYANLSAEPDSWRLGLAGKSFTAIYNDTGGELASCWLGTLDAFIAGDSKLTGDFKGFFFSDAGDGHLKVAAISGDASGYIEVAEGNGTWQAGSIGEWVEVTDLLSEYDMFGEGGMGMLNEFVSVPITEVCSNLLTGGGAFDAGGTISAAMNINLYAQAAEATNGIWAAFINGNYSGSTGNGWSVNVADGDNQALLSGTQWNNGQWLADVQGTIGDNSISGQAGGTYSEGAFTGASAGGWSEASPVSGE